MDFKDQIKQFSDRVSKLKDNIHTEEATKNAFIMPFLQILGYDVFNPMEVVPEFICDVGIKKGEKIDYAILRDGAPIILVECKHWKQKLDVHDGQLLRYFHVSKAKFSMLTNGLIFRFYTDLVEPNKMDEKPFLEFNIEEIKDGQIEQLKEFHKAYFDIDNIYQSASELKYINEIRQLINQEFYEPNDEFVKYFARQVYPSVVTSKVLEAFRVLVKRTIANIINDTINDRLKSAISKPDSPIQEESTPVTLPGGANAQEREIVTTQEELEGFYIVRSLLRQKVPSSRITHRDALSYFAIFLDDNNRKPLCRLYLNNSKKFIGLFDSDKKESKMEIQTIDDIYKFGSQLDNTVEIYLDTKK
ncbi:MAG: type I restriction enzyme HsdR N-terminal domain-containing protein [Dyadobacter sp.]|uniref:type I restriction endonuclease n=1 Tax=Dyadobacter sp. TaxID=1914288 RepID=UPI001B23D596|nr:type I restriction endonuclease [Dyadobacter sp.]MBO9614623.1 type I restriction enzyme HsdR N-terminal domain-containing protein [Dyadobacter sp.]